MVRVRLRFRFVFVAAAIVGVGGCSLTTDFGHLTGAAGADGGAVVLTDALAVDAITSDVANDGGDDAGGPRCAGRAGPTPVNVGSYCIDATEVTGKQYRLFLDEMGSDFSGQPPECAWNQSFQPLIGNIDDRPTSALDWCDAFAYCKWAGKRLCGKVGGGPVSGAAIGSPNVDEWTRACTHEGTRKFPYGTDFDVTACAGPNNPVTGGGPVAVGTLTKCEGGYPGIFDMGGNVWEWIDGCGAGDADAPCLVRGGSYAANNDLSCGREATARRDRTGGGLNDVGIRCCSDAL